MNYYYSSLITFILINFYKYSICPSKKSFGRCKSPAQAFFSFLFLIIIASETFHFHVQAYNLDTDIPIIKTGPTGSYFGFSVAQHTINFNSLPNPEPVILVGAPLSDYSGSKVVKPGAVYKCPVSPRMDDCARLKIDDDLPPDKDEDRNNQWLGVTIKSHENGESVVTCGHRYSRSGADYHWGFGICYSLSSTLAYEDVYSPCVGRPVFKAHQQFGYCQAGTSVHLAANDDLVIGAPGSYTWTGALFKNNIATGIFADKRWFFSPLESPDPVPVPHYSFLGMSVYSGQFHTPHSQSNSNSNSNYDYDSSMANSKSHNPISYISGAPRTNGTGCVVVFETNAQQTFSTTLVPALTLKGREVLGESFGYEVQGIDINADGYLDLAVGAPFYYDVSDESIGGAVYIFLNGPDGFDTDNPVFITGKNDSMFGYSIAPIGDLNQDGFKDLAIGAPNTDNGRGSVYIYHGGPNSIITNILDNDDPTNTPEINLPNLKKLNSKSSTSTPKFKISKKILTRYENTMMPAQIITPQGMRYRETPNYDSTLLNYNGLPSSQQDSGNDDPFYGNFENNPRRVEDPWNRRRAKRQFENILHKQNEDEIYTFGHSISGEIDMDKNGYPDLLVGTYKSDKIFLLRSRPIVNIYTEVRELPNAIDPLNPHAFPCPAGIMNITSSPTYDRNAKKLRGDICFPIKVCFRFGAHPASTFISDLTIRYTLTAERFGSEAKKPFSRIKFISKRSLGKDKRQNTPEIEDKLYLATNTLKLAPQISHQFICDSVTAYLKPETKDFLRPINFQLMVNLTNQVPEQYMDDPLIDINTYPVLNPDMAVKTFQVQFLKDCGANEICESDIQLDTSLVLPQAANKDYLITLGQSKHLGLQVLIENFGEAAYESELYIHFSQRISYVGVKLPNTISSPQSKSKSYSCSLFNDTLIKCEIGNPFKADDKVEFVFTFDVTNLKLEDNNITFAVNVTTTSADKHTYPKNQTLKALIIIKSEMSITGVSSPEQIFFGRFVRGESSMTNELDIGNPVEHRYVVNNDGPGTISSSFVEINWPFEVENKREHGKWLLYMTRYPWVDGNGACEIDPQYVNYLKLKLQPRTTPQAKRLKHKKPHQKSSSGGKQSFTKSSKSSSHTKTIFKKYKRGLDRTYKAIKQKFKRELIILPEPQIIGGKLRNVVTMDCQKGTAKCLKFTCQVGELAPHQSVVIHIRGRIWNSTFVEDYAKMDAISIISRANLTIDKKYNVEQNTTNDMAFVETLAYPDIDILTEYKETEPWIIVVAICSGIFIFFLITILLWKLGFFKRKVIKPPYSARLEKAHYDDLNDL